MSMHICIWTFSSTTQTEPLNSYPLYWLSIEHPGPSPHISFWTNHWASQRCPRLHNDHSIVSPHAIYTCSLFETSKCLLVYLLTCSYMELQKDLWDTLQSLPDPLHTCLIWTLHRANQNISTHSLHGPSNVPIIFSPFIYLYGSTVGQFQTLSYLPI